MGGAKCSCSLAYISLFAPAGHRGSQQGEGACVRSNWPDVNWLPAQPSLEPEMIDQSREVGGVISPQSVYW